jgi:hypothetical protein
MGCLPVSLIQCSLARSLLKGRTSATMLKFLASLNVVPFAKSTSERTKVQELRIETAIGLCDMHMQVPSRAIIAVLKPCLTPCFIYCTSLTCQSGTGDALSHPATRYHLSRIWIWKILIKGLLVSHFLDRYSAVRVRTRFYYSITNWWVDMIRTINQNCSHTPHPIGDIILKGA